MNKLKKAIGVIIVTLLGLIPTINYASETNEIKLDSYTTLGLREVLESEGIEAQFKKYSETDDQITIYMFRGQTCGYCKAFLNFLNSITDEYGKYFKLVSFETWYDNNNSKLLKTISNFANNPAGGVPYIVIGEHVFPGYASDYDESIKTAIMELYNSSDRYDIFEAYNESIKKSNKSDSSSTATIIICNFLFTAISTLIIVATIKNTTKNNTNSSEEEVEEEKETKKTVKKKPTKKNHEE